LKRNGIVVGELADDSKMLGFFGVQSGNEIHVIDTDPYSLSRGGGLTDTSLIEKYTMSEDVYASRKGTLREYIREQKAKAAADKKSGQSSDGAIPADTGLDSVSHAVLGSRCEVMPGKRRGTVRYVGEVAQLKGGFWVSNYSSYYRSTIISLRRSGSFLTSLVG
jgi:tubulin-specific chaperone B